MANTIKIKRSTSTAQPADSTLAAGELAYSSSSGKLFIGHPDGSTAAPQLIGYLSPTEGTLSASKPIVVDSNSKIDVLNVDNITIDGNAITSTDTNGNITLTPNGTGAVRVSKFEIGDPSSTGYGFPTATGSSGQILSVDSNGDLAFAASVSGANDSTITISGGTGLKTGGSFTTDQSSDSTITLNLDVTNLTAVTAVAQGDEFIMADASDSNNEKKITFSTLEDAVFGNISGDATVAAGGALTIGSGVVENGMMAANSVDSDQYVDGSIDTAHIGDDQVTNAKLANITRGSIKVGGTSNAPTDLDAKTSGYILVGDGTDVNSVAVSGDVTLSSAGAVTIASGAVETAMIGDDQVTNAKLADDAVDSDQIANGAVDNVHLAGSIANGKLANSSVTVGSTAISLGSSATTIDGLNTVHGIDGSGTDAAGTNLTIQGGGGTGTGAGGSILFQVADGGSTGSSVNTFATALTIADDGDITAAQNFTVSGNLTVSGTTTTVNSETVTFDDNILVLNNNYSGGSPTENAGIEVERGTVANVALRWNETSDKWQITEDGSAYKNIIHADSDVDGGTF